MRTKQLLLRCALSLLCICCVARARADVWGFASIDYDDVYGQVIADCETQISLEDQQYYQPIVDCWLNDGTGYGIGYGTDWEIYSNDAFAEIYADADPDETYTVEVQNSVELYFFRPNYGYYDLQDYSYWLNQNIYASCCFDFYPGPYGPQDGPDTEITQGTEYAQVTTPPPPNQLRINQWCLESNGINNNLHYWLMDPNGSGGITNQVWDIVERQTDCCLTYNSGSPYGSCTSAQTGNKFDDTIAGVGNHTSSQIFFIARGPARPNFGVSISWFGTPRAGNSISIAPGSVTVNNLSQPAPNSCRP